jgi:hypothetical protein
LTLRLTLLARAYCHLCDEMREGVLRLAAGRPVVVEELDVDASAELEARYGDLVPVLFAGPVAAGRELCHYVLDEACVRAFLAEGGPG